MTVVCCTMSNRFIFIIYTACPKRSVDMTVVCCTMSNRFIFIIYTACPKRSVDMTVVCFTDLFLLFIQPVLRGL